MNRCPTCRRPLRRRNPQNALLWALYHRMAEREWNGQRFSAEAFHEYYKRRFLGADDVPLPNGRTITVAHSTAHLGVDEFSDYFDRVQADANERGVYLEGDDD